MQKTILKAPNLLLINNITYQTTNQETHKNAY